MAVIRAMKTLHPEKCKIEGRGMTKHLKFPILSARNPARGGPTTSATGMTPLTRATCKETVRRVRSGLSPGPHLLHRQAEGPHVDDQVGVEHHQAPALEEKYEFDPEQVSFTQIIPEPAEVRSVPVMFGILRISPSELGPFLGEGLR